MKKDFCILQIITIILLLLWIPVSIDKLINFSTFRAGILRQPFPKQLGYFLIYALPLLEIFTVILILISKYRWIGYWLSSLLMAVFTIYISMALMGAWDKLPCGCGSVISGMNWKQHLWFNLFFLVMSILGIVLKKKIYTNCQEFSGIFSTTSTHSENNKKKPTQKL